MNIYTNQVLISKIQWYALGIEYLGIYVPKIKKWICMLGHMYKSRIDFWKKIGVHGSIYKLDSDISGKLVCIRY